MEGNTKGRCSAVGSATVHQKACSTRLPFICIKEIADIVTSETSVTSTKAVSVEDMALAKPSGQLCDNCVGRCWSVRMRSNLRAGVMECVSVSFLGHGACMLRTAWC